ncbi:MAG: hypothetical protein UX49_C0014G0010 [Candidatus Wolfebacteria bacterium GW2011_GWC2_46_275]|uniref:Uncharacterized protein n=2 Tax=Candidatus Wolfeibacteriota TaxID=1752735 RepID=A0A0G1X4R3_9BACT|nr:MAG: hypothetical protein UX70_C0001G0634 [Candidatus Wolfebacteria bacterium GW2011_GWB1_47_1]KKU36529.1 MAG: hypothetical protein UX49_C0014G0010 [Candidatus Wolfebacteria bacterium GW2011_GWC2_46_275]KKU42440.1 MAG: hypothetical protein UX58_C0002G0154 [Candidatus Wolfebacteria bacterium GW2011_GWB2_46_69]KKU54225.1 MAG: hypothetical protein UX76_C0004G0029 [Candidatus Wolfebacteria bacterium GW2011_GWC1_47_103]KKU59593.1 MAG: hypothetical protein UX83_C0003G0008 [Candidatus Wolfebacteria
MGTDELQGVGKSARESYYVYADQADRTPQYSKSPSLFVFLTQSNIIVSLGLLSIVTCANPSASSVS